MTPFRLQIFCGKIRAAMDCLKYVRFSSSPG